MAGLGPTELIIILVIVIIVFGVGRIGKIGKEMGEGVKGFRQGIKEANSDVVNEIEEKAG